MRVKVSQDATSKKERILVMTDLLASAGSLARPYVSSIMPQLLQELQARDRGDGGEKPPLPRFSLRGPSVIVGQKQLIVHVRKTSVRVYIMCVYRIKQNAFRVL